MNKIFHRQNINALRILLHVVKTFSLINNRTFWKRFDECSYVVRRMFKYCELDSSGSVNKWTKRLFETKVWEKKTALIVQRKIPPYYDKIQEFKKTCLKSNQLHAVSMTVEGHTWQLRVTWQMFILCYQGSSKQCYNRTKQLLFNNKTFITHLLQNKTQTM